MALQENDSLRTVFVNYRKEGGISWDYDPELDQFAYSVFIHSRFPRLEVESRQFLTFEQARHYAASLFVSTKGWEMYQWDFKTKRPCEEGGKECGSGDCDTCRDLAKEQSADPNAKKGCGACGAAG